MKHKTTVNKVKSFEHVLAASYGGTESKELIAFVDYELEDARKVNYVIKKNREIIGNTPELVKAVKFYNEQ